MAAEPVNRERSFTIGDVLASTERSCGRLRAGWFSVRPWPSLRNL